MTQSLLAKLDELQVKVSGLAKVLEQSRHDNKAAKAQIEVLRSNNQKLQKKIEQTQEQVEQILSQWFPEPKPNAEE